MPAGAGQRLDELPGKNHNRTVASGGRLGPTRRYGRVRTTIALDHVGRLIEERDENPFDLLGPHVVEDQGRRALAVRAYLPHSTQAWVVDPATARRAAADAPHPPGRPVRSDLSDADNRLGQQIPFANRGRKRQSHQHARSVRVSPRTDRIRSVPSRRRDATGAATTGWGRNCAPSTASRE